MVDGYAQRYRRTYRLLKRFGFSPVKAMEIIIDAKRGQSPTGCRTHTLRPSHRNHWRIFRLTFRCFSIMSMTKSSASGLASTRRLPGFGCAV